MVLEVGLIKGPEWGVNVEVAVKRNGKVGVMEASGHVVEFFRSGRVCVEVVCIQGDIHQHDRAGGSGSGGNKRKGRNSIN